MLAYQINFQKQERFLLLLETDQLEDLGSLSVAMIGTGVFSGFCSFKML